MPTWCACSNGSSSVRCCRRCPSGWRWRAPSSSTTSRSSPCCADEVQRRDQQALERHLLQAGFEDRVTLDGFDWNSPVQLDRRQLQQVFTLEFLARKEHTVFVGPVGVGKTLLAQCLGSAAVRADHSVVFIRADALLAELGQARADRSYDKVFRRYLAPDLVILDDFGLRRLTAQQSNDLYELIIERHRHASFCITSNRSVDEWLGLFDDPILGNSAWIDLRTPRIRSSSKDPAIAPSSHPSIASWTTSHDPGRQHAQA